VGLRAVDRGDEGRNGGGNGAGLSKAIKKIQKLGGQGPAHQAKRIAACEFDVYKRWNVGSG
jgi:hypothetical protein